MGLHRKWYMSACVYVNVCLLVCLCMYLCHYTCACSINLIDICTLKRQCVGVVYPSKAVKVYYIINTNHKVSDDICTVNYNI